MKIFINRFLLKNSIKCLNEKFKRRSKHLLHSNTVPNKFVKMTLQVKKELNSSQTDGNESGICVGASSSSSNEININDLDAKSKLKVFHFKMVSSDNTSDGGMDDNYEYDEFKDNEFISSTLLLDS